MKRVLSISLTLAMLVAFTVPAFASDGTAIPVETDPTTETGPVPETPEVPETLESPEIPDTPNIPENPNISENPETPDAPESPENPNAAETPEGPEQQGPIGGTDDSLPEEPAIINVSVPSSCRVIINPYQLEIELDGETHTEQIVSEICAMTNLSEVPVSVSVTTSGMVYGQGDMMFVGDPPTEETYWKELFLYIEFLHELSDGVWSWQYTGAVNQVPIAPEPNERLNVLELDPGETGFYRMFGTVTTYPELPWDIGDDFRVTLTFTFTPVSAELEEFLEIPETPEFPEQPETSESSNVPETSGLPEPPKEPEFSVDLAEVPEETADPDGNKWEETLL